MLRGVTALSLLAAFSTQADAQHNCLPWLVIQISIKANGAILWNDQPIKDRAQLRAWLKAVGDEDPHPTIFLKPDPASKHGWLMSVVEDARKAGAYCLAMTDRDFGVPD